MENSDWILRQQEDGDASEMEELYDTVFGPTRRLLSSYRLREGVAPVAELGFVLRDAAGTLVAAICSWPVCIDHHPALLVGPIGVHPIRQGEGFGGFLIRHSLSAAATTLMPADAGEAGCWSRAVLVGDAPYYERFGFRRALATGVAFPAPTDPARILVHELVPGAMDGVTGKVRAWNDRRGDKA